MHYLVSTSSSEIAAGSFLINPVLKTFAALPAMSGDFGHVAKQAKNLLGKNLPGYTEYARRSPHACRALRGTDDHL